MSDLGERKGWEERREERRGEERGGVEIYVVVLTGDFRDRNSSNNPRMKNSD